MRQFSAAQLLAAFISLVFIVFIAGCGNNGVQTPVAASIALAPSTLSLNEGQVSAVSAIARDGNGTVVAVDFTFSSSNPALASISSAAKPGSICAVR